MKHTEESLARDNLWSTVIRSRIKPIKRMRSSLPAMSISESDERSPLKKEKKPIYGAEELHYPSTSTEEMLSMTEWNVARIWSTLQLKLPPRNSTIESHLRRRLIAQCEVDYCKSTSTYTLLECSAIHESNVPTKIENLQMRTIAHGKVHLRLRHSLLQRSTGALETTKRSYMMQDKRWTACTWLESPHPEFQWLRNSNNGAWQRSRRPRSAYRNPCTGEGYDIHAFWYWATLMRGGPGDILIAKAIIVVANPSGLQDIVNTQLGQPEVRGDSSVMLLAPIISDLLAWEEVAVAFAL